MVSIQRPAFTAGGAYFVWASERDGRNRLAAPARGRRKLVRALRTREPAGRASSGVAWVQGLCALDEAGGWVYRHQRRAHRPGALPLAAGRVTRRLTKPGSHPGIPQPSMQYASIRPPSRPPG